MSWCGHAISPSIFDSRGVKFSVGGRVGWAGPVLTTRQHLQEHRARRVKQRFVPPPDFIPPNVLNPRGTEFYTGLVRRLLHSCRPRVVFLSCRQPFFFETAFWATALPSHGRPPPQPTRPWCGPFAAPSVPTINMRSAGCLRSRQALQVYIFRVHQKLPNHREHRKGRLSPPPPANSCPGVDRSRAVLPFVFRWGGCVLFPASFPRSYRTSAAVPPVRVSADWSAR